MIRTFFQGLLQRFGIDSAIAYTVFARGLQGLGGFASIAFVAFFLNKAEQGFYYTFGSILAIQVFFELGLTGIITQFVAHESASVRWNGTYELHASNEILSKLASILRFSVKWFSIAACLLLIILIIAGYFFFGRYNEDAQGVDWFFPWVTVSLATAISLIGAPVLAFLEGLGKVAEVARIRLCQQLVQVVLTLSLLASGFKLYSSPLALLLASCIVPIYLLSSLWRPLLVKIWHALSDWQISYRKEIFPYQWKISLSWISGYFIYQLFNPVIFATEGAVNAGKMGMSLAVLNGITMVALSWINTKVPQFSMLIAKKEYLSLDKVFRTTLKQTSAVILFALSCFVFGLWVLSVNEIPLVNRFLPFTLLILLCITTFVNQVITSLAVYLRCHKKEPLMFYSLIMAIFTTASTLGLGYLYGVAGIVAGYCVLTTFIGLPWVIRVFFTKRRLWHADEDKLIAE